jgi:hypothetical protein
LPSRQVDTYCQQSQKEVRCWELQRLRHSQPQSIVLKRTATTTCLLDSTEQEIESPMQINGDLNGFIANGEASSTAHSSQKGTVVVVNGSSTQHSNGHSNGVNGESPKMEPLPPVSLNELDVPLPTANGGYTHTLASKAKIGAANKGKTPWNKGRKRSEEDKARIAAGVRARNRENFLQKLKDMDTTEEEYEEKKKEERRIKDTERRSRRTENGGYRPTEETKAKISRILKEKHARGEIKHRACDPSKVRRGFTHSDETKRKISEALKKRWSADSGYREKMTQTMKTTYSKEEIRKKVSVTLKKRWQDPKFREEMLEKMRKNRKSPKVTSDYREKISNSMKAKWQDPEYREKTLNAIAKHHNESLDGKPRVRKPSKPRGSSKEVQMMKPLAPGESVPKVKRARKKKQKSVDALESDKSTKSLTTKAAVKVKDTEKKKAKEPDGSVDRLREERRDLFDLLYGDEQFDGDSDDSDDDLLDDDPQDRPSSTRFDLGDEDLDSYDPYGLDDY